MRNRYHVTASVTTLADLAELLSRHDHPVLLVEGIRALPEADQPRVAAIGRMLAERLSGVRFRSGNAEGTDTAFAEGVTAIAPERMEYVVTHAGMGLKRRATGCRAVALADMKHAADGEVGDYTLQASPDRSGLVAAYRATGRAGALGAKAAYLLRDTLKVTGSPDVGLAPAAAGLFYVNEEDPLAGGTGHTIRVCIDRGVPVIVQATWLRWLEA